MGKCENLALPENFEELERRYTECLDEYLNVAELGGIFITPDSDEETIEEWESAKEHCSHLLPHYNRQFEPATPEVMVSSLQTWIASVLTCNRFHIVNHAYVQAYRESLQLQGIPVKEDKSTIPEYYFEGTYDCARDPVIREHENQYGEIIEEQLYPSSLTIRMYLEGEQKELVTEWTTSGTMHFWSGLTNRMFKNPNAVMRQDVPITDLLEEFERKPVFCSMRPEKSTLNKGEETEIDISDLYDARMNVSREFNRILVHASEGEILNGEKSEISKEYRVFRLDKLPVVVKYKAPDHGGATSARITVFNSCDILPLAKLPLRKTALKEQIGSHDILLNNYDWSGTINLEITRTYNCDVEEQVSALHYSRTRAADHKRTVANITLGLSDFNLPVTGTSAGAKLQYISGQITENIREDHTTNGYAEKTECLNKGTGRHEWVSPGNWSTRHETSSGQTYCDIEEGGITMMIVKEQFADRDAMQNTQQQMAEMQAKLQEALKTMDTEAMDKIKEDMQKIMLGDQTGSTIPVKVVLTIAAGAKRYPVYKSYDRKVYNVCRGEYEVNESRSETIEMPLILPIGAELTGEYIKDKDGRDRIEASVNITEPTHPTFGSDLCPEGEISITGSITLKRDNNHAN